MLVFVAEEENLAEMLFRMGLDFRNPVEHGSFEIELHHDAESLGETGVHSDWEIQGTYLALVDEPRERRQGLSELTTRILFRVITVFAGTEDFLYFRVVVEKGEENGNALDNGGAQ